MPVYHLKGKSYNIPDNVVAQFEKDNPNATVNYQANGKTYGIPVSKRDGFLQKYPDAVLEGQQQTKKEEAPAPTPQPQAAQPQQTQKGGYKPTEQEMMGFGMSVGGAQNTVKNTTKGIDTLQEATKKASPFGSGNVGLGNNNNLRKGEKTFDAEKGAFVDTYLTSDGRKFNDIQQANQVQEALDDTASMARYNELMQSIGVDMEAEGKKDINHLLGDAYDELHKLDADIEGHRKSQGVSLAMGMGLAGSHGMGTRKKDTDLDNLLSAKRLLERRIDALEAARDNGGFWSGTADVLTDPSSYSFGLTDLADSKAMMGISKRIDEAKANGTKPQLTDSEKSLVRNYMLNQQAQSKNADNTWYEFGKGFGQTLSFMKDFAVTGGGFAGIAKSGMALGAKGGTKLATKALGDYMTKNLGTKALGKTMEYMGKGLGLAAGAEVGGLALNNTAQAASSMADVMNKQMGNLTVGKDGNLSFEGSKSLGEAVLKSQLSRGGENASELVGLAFDAVPGILGKVIQRTKVGQLAKKVANSKLWKGYEKGMDYLGVQSLWGEGMEEEYNMARDVLIGESSWFKDPNDPNKPAFFDGEQQLKTWETVGITSMLLRVPSMIATGTQGANYYANQYNLNTSDRNMRGVFGDYVRYETVKAMMDGADNSQLPGVLNNLMNNAQLSREEKEAMFMYANDLVKLRGFNIGNVVAAANGFTAPPRVSGYNIKGNTIEEIDEEGNVLATHEYENRDEMKAGLYELQQTRFDNDLNSDISVIKARPDNQFDTLVQDYLMQADTDMLPSAFEEILAKPSMERTEVEQAMVEPFAKLIHETVYDNTMLHEEQSAVDGGKTAENASMDINNVNNPEVQQVSAAWEAAQESRRQLFEKNDKIREEVETRENQGMPHQQIISELETFLGDEVQAVIDYYNQKARYEAMINRLNNKIDEEAANQRQRHTFKGTIDGQADLSNVYTITDGTNTYYLVSGNITTDKTTGEITGSDSGLIIGMDLDGSFVNIGDTNGYSVMPSVQTLDQFEEQERTRLQNEWTASIMPNGPQVQPETPATPQNPETPEVPQQKAIDRIPKDEQGNLLYEQASPEDTYDAFVEQVGEDTAKVLAKKQIDTATKALEKLNKKMEKGDFEGNTIQEQIESSKALAQQIAATQATINHWNQVLSVPNNRMLNEANNQPAAPANNPPTPPTPPTPPQDEVPEYRYDTPQAARDRGYKVVEGQRIDRQQEKEMPQGQEVEVQYSTKDKVKGRLTVSELDEVQGSHLTNGQVNDKHFIPEAQPKAEFGADRQAAAMRNASEENFRPELMLTFNGTQSAYSGSAPQTNRRGEVIQGNGRRNLAEYIYAPGNEAVAQKYKTFLKAHAEELGTTPEAIDAMEKPFAHIMLDVDDAEAIRLGQFTAADLETGGKKIPEVTQTVTKLGDKYGSFANILLNHEDPDASLAERIEKNMADAIGWLNRGGYISDTEAKSLFEDKDAARQFFKDMLTDVLFKGAHPDLRTMFYELPKNIQSAIVSVVGREVGLGQDESILKDIQESIMAYHELMASSPQFAKVKGNSFEARYAAAKAAVEDWLRQINLDGSLNTGKYSNFALELAKLYVSLKDQKTLASRLREYYDIMSNAPREGGLFDAPAETGTMTREQAVKEIFGVENGTQRTMPVAGNNQASQGGPGGGPSTTQSGESEPEGEGPANIGGGNTGQSPVGEGSPQVSEREQYIADHPLTEAEIDAANASPAQKILAKQYLNSKDDFVSEMAKAAYTYIYNKKVAAQNQGQQPTTPSAPASEQPSRPRSEAPAKPQTPQGPTKPKTIQEIVQGYYEEAGEKAAAKAAAKAKMATALAKLKKHGKKSDNNTDAYSIENLTPEQIEDMFEVVEAGAELGYTLLDGVQTKDEWIAQMREAIAEPLKDATGYNDTEVDELLNDMWNYPYAVEGEVKTVSEWAAEKGINVNEIENGTGESNGDNTPTELPGSTTVGGSTEAGVESGGNNEGQPESGEQGSSGTVVSGGNRGTGEVNETPNGGTNQPNETTSSENGGSRTEGGDQPLGGTAQPVGQTSQGNQANTGSTNGKGKSRGSTGQTRGKAGGTRQSGQPGNLFGEDNGNGSNDNPGIEQGGTAATVPESGIVVPPASKKPLADITQEKSPYKPSSIGGKFAIGSVIPSGIADSIANAFKRLKEKFFPKKGSTLDFVRNELGYKTNEEMLSDFESGKTDGLAAEQVDAVALAIGKMKDGKSFIVGDMTGVGKGRTAAALIRWGLKHGKKVLFVTENSGLFSDMYRDLTDIGSDYMPFVTNSDSNANITDADGNKVVPKPMLAAQKALWQSGSDKLPRDKKGRQYDFVMTTYSQVNGNEKGDKKKAEWLREYAKDAIVIMDESHNASGESNTGAYFREVVENASGVTFLSATYAKRPDNMLLYAIKSSMSAINMPVQSFLEAIKEYGVAMQELMASALFGSGEMIRRERDMSDVKTTWTEPLDIYSEEEYEQCRKTSDKTMDLINDIIQFQRDYVNPIVKDHEKDYDQQNKLAALIGGVQTHAGNTAYKSQVSNITNLMVYAMKAKKAAEMAIEQIKQGKKPVIAVSNTMGSYIDELEDDIPEAGFRPIFEKGVKFSLRYVIADYEKGDDGRYHKIKGSERVFDAEDELSDAGQRALDNLRQRIEDYMGDTDKVDLSLSPIDLVKQMIADAGYNCGEITGRSTQLVKKEGGGYTKTSIRQNKKEAARKFNGGSKDKPIPEDEQYQALILNVAGATGISLHSSKKFGNQQPRTMIILQPNADVNKEVQMRGRIDRTGQVHRGEYFYMSSPIPAEQKITMMLKQKLASLDAQSVGTKQVSSNKVEGQDMDNKYGDEVCYQYLLEHLNDVNAYLEGGLKWNEKTREFVGYPGLLYSVMKDLQRMPCEMQEKVIAELTQRYADQIDYLNQNGINDLETTTMDLEAVTIDKATFVKGKDNESENEFAHDTSIERVEVNVLKKPMRSSDIKKKMKDLDSLDEDGLPKEGVLGQTTEKVKEMVEKKLADRQAKYDEQENKLYEKIKAEHPQKADQTDEEWLDMVYNWPTLAEMRNKHKADLTQYSADLQSQYNDVYKAAMYLKPGRPYLVPLTDDVGDNAFMMYGRFLGFQVKNGDPRQVQAVFAVKDSRAMVTIPIVNQKKVIEKILNERNDIEIVELERDKDTYDQLPMEQKVKNWDEWWDKMIPKNTNRQIRYMITGNVLQACGSLGKYKGQIITFSRKNPKTGEITLERGMLLAENFDPENFHVRRPVEKKDVWDSYDEVKDERSGVSCHREGNNMVVKFEKRKGEKLSEHPAQKDETLKQMAMNNEIRPSGKTAILCVIKEDNVEKALEHLYKEYGYTKEELFVMPDSTEKPDAIVRSNRPWQEVIDELAEKYGRNYYAVDAKIKQMLKRYKMDVNNDDLKQQIREAVQLRQAYLRRDYATKESNRLAWEVLINDERIERYKDDKDQRERYMRIRDAILEELEFRGFKGNAYHYEQGKITIDDVKKMFNQMNDLTTEEGRAKKALFDKVMEKVSKLPMEIFMNEKLDNDTGGFAGGRVINYNWKYMNADYIADQAKADTILHELIHTVTAYADRCVEAGLDHLLDKDMLDAINELHGILDAIKHDPTFVHDGQPGYGLTNVREMLSEAGSNSEFRADLKKTNLWMKLWSGILKFFGIKQNVSNAKQVNAFDLVMERLDYLIENFNQQAWDTYYAGSGMGGYGYKKADMQRLDTSKSYEIGKYKGYGPISAFFKTQTAPVMQNGKKVANIYKSEQGYQAETPNWSYATEWYPTEKEALDALAKYQEESDKLSDAEVEDIVSAMKENAKPMPSVEVTDENWKDNVDTPIGRVKMGENQREKLFDKKRGEQYGMLLETLSNPDIVLEEKDSIPDPNHERPTSYLFVKTFTKPDGSKYVHFESVTVSKDGMEVSISSHIIRENQLRNKLKSDRLLYKATALDESVNSSAEQPINEGDGLSSGGKDTKKYNTAQENRQKVAKINTSKRQKDDMIDRRVYDPIESVNRAAEDWRRAEADRKADVADLDSYSAKQVYHERINRAETMFTESWQDDMVTFKAAQNAIAKDKDIPDSQNAYQAMNLSYGKTYVEQEQFENQYKKPLIETVNKILKKTGWRMGDVDRYLFTKHGFERNRELFVRDWLQLERVKAKDDQTQLDHLDGLESDYIMMKNENYQKLMEGKITFKQYLDAIDSFIKGNMDKKYVPEKHDYSGFTEMFGDKDGDYDEADILAEMEQLENEMGDSLRDQLWSRINDCSQYGLDRYRQSGMISEDTYKRISNMFHWYVPMRGFNEGMASQDHWQYMTAKDGAGRIGGLLKKAKGRKSEAGFPLATLFGMTNKAISDCNQNEVKQHLWRLVQAHPNDLVKVSDAWVVKDPTTGEWKTAYPQIDSDMSPQMKEAKVKEFEERMRHLEASGDAMRLKNSAKRTRFDYKVDNQHRGEHIVEVMINGDRKYMIVTGNPRMALAINGELRYQGGKGMVSRALNAMKQFMQSVSTSFNITFLGRNMARDWTHFGAILAVREGAGYEKAAQKYYWKQLPKMVSLFKKFREGKLDMRNEMERDFKDFMENGGITGFVNMQKVEAIQKEMENFIKKQKDGSLLKVNSKFYDLTLGAIEAMNEAIENNARFATYRASRHYAGRTKARSAYDAKEVTVNFNKKGAGRKTAGFKSDLGKKTTTIKTPFGSKTIEYNPVEASAKLWGETGQILAANKMFFNATVQAICTIFKNTQNKDGSLNWPYIAKLASAYAAPPFILGFVMPYINQQLVALAGGDGDDDPYANLPEWTRRKNICLYLGWIPGFGKDDFLTIPIGQELAAFYSLGDMLAGKTYDKNLEPIDKDFADEMLGFLNVFSPVDFDTKITSEDHAAPISEYVGRVYSVAAPLVAIGENMSWNGRPIFRNDKYNGDEYIPEYKMAFNSTNQQFVAASKFLNDISGGDDVSRGAIQINPATMQYLVEQYTGGPGKLFANTLVSAGRDLKNFITNDEVDFNIRKIEGIRAFYQQGDGRTQFYRTQAKYRKYKEEADEFGYKLKAYEKDAATNPDHYMKLMELARGKELARYNIINEVDKSLREVNTAANQATGRDRKNIRALYNEQLKYIVDELDKVQDIE